jgi:very-short-patch-repair endonuclease
MSDEHPQGRQVSLFEQIRHEDEDDNECWSARELSAALGYTTNWRNFQPVIRRAMEVCEGSGQRVSDHFAPRPLLAQLGFGAVREIEDYALSRFALHFVLICGDLQKPKILQTLIYLTLATLNENSDYCLRGGAFGVSFSSEIALTREQKTISQIVAAFAHLRAERQYRVPPYAVDLYFPDHRIAVEYDEHGHRNYNKKAETRRQQHLEQALACTVGRYNPDAPGFNVGDVINRIMLLVYDPIRQNVAAS